MGKPLLTVVLVVMMVLVATGQAQGHTIAELDEWTEEWVALADESLTPQLTGRLVDMTSRHPWYFDPQPSRVTGETRTSPSWSGSVESWRGLVSLHFPADQVDRALCIMELESHGNPNAKNPRSSAAGLFQFVRDTWDRVPLSVSGGSYDSGRVYLPEPNVASAAWLQGRSGWWPWSPYLNGLCR